MIKINLLPREERKRRAPLPTGLFLALAGILCILAGMAYGWYWLNSEVNGLAANIQNTEIELKRFEELAKQVDRYQAEKKRLEEKIKVISSLVTAQTGPVRILDEVSKALPNEVWLTSLARTGKKLDIQGVAYSNFSVANFMTNLSGVTSLITSVDLVESVKGSVEQVPVERFSITAELKEPKG